MPIKHSSPAPNAVIKTENFIRSVPSMSVRWSGISSIPRSPPGPGSYRDLFRKVLGMALSEPSVRGERNRVVHHHVHLPSSPLRKISAILPPIPFSLTKIVYYLK
jgi:hypothetical protein